MKTAWSGVRVTTIACLAAAALAPHVAQAAQPEDDPDKVARWLDFKEGTFKGRAIETHGDAVIKLDAPARAADASVVPIAINAQFPQTPSHYIRKIYLFIDENPEPYAGSFEFTPESGFATIETRVRVEDYTFMRAIAETNDGKLYSAIRFVKASGGCSAPADKDEDAAERAAGQLRLQAEGQAVAGKPELAQLMVRHPNRTGMAMNQVTRNYATAYFIRKISVTYADKPVMTANVNFSISENPNVRFYFVPSANGELKAQVEDTKNKQWGGAVAVTAQPGGGQTSAMK
ncbi:quinoprotein dehydrogenase-associated SoxYZ-like carrier [Burkholderia sp. SFA1]|uniref:quinoprotein dehydrogenase-associated SoxYZ-like carrier n=1 Tax=unclassified Caballeronia TaxID=2646786 RepID=UPI001F1E684B|nr:MULTISPECIES: quinoprotein dehydrogenase-associated SoxYZ-like carrier [unclassified Caballeronia]MCE4545477.1 quinoprotein dehydrogenase-associated SoxYZ-like carrier [Caballeronia sp. PC1]MCE4570903.1 quinoprotein dehydrogenase-associated SoxYZ-like carrier [Caballeronia sp. CLC5]BBP99253.1 quinoprotein dehydrogenase-associated SoxYZ-like carrier [Burkholderia sp. SFA1]